ncbi:LOW QUALITY PROTEIN: ATPase family AAA domain-containing protein 5 [Boleophthalmus pectinirostris]|uniref:LOW QUALITY PROTEIN: ATPase family AAA domain-containing protein 5 n=1 Tax=Boleophthalmus pectinirostris TaxID=150288 RepID=UPI00242A3817|nr:LOW QUALITY PROTEIN: ATPase family AAA domain-containing protein 5 [Boleophthalmus pectinirostris]
MAGIVAMASVIEDFDIQPCKKTCKNVDSPVVKTITNYFSPVSKPTEKPFSPPRSNNIMDYFNRKGPSPKDRVLSPNQAKENCQTGKLSTSLSVPKQPSSKRSRKTSKAARKLVETAEDDSCIIVEEMDSTDNGAKFSTVLGSDTAVLLGQICSESSVSEESSNHKVEKSDQHKKSLLVKSSQHLNSIDLSPILPTKSKCRKGKTSTGKKSKESEDQLPEPEETTKSLDDVSMEVNVGDTSQLHHSMVTISFEEFVRSQDSTNDELCKETESVTENKQLQLTNAEDNCVSPRIVTIQAEVHAISPKEKGKNAGKVASIFTKGKGTSPVPATSPQPEPDSQVQGTASRRKSNVVLEESDVELCVLESSSVPKCSQAERKQFMAAFKQPGFDGTKNKPIKSQGKLKQSGDNIADATDKVSEEEAEIQFTDVQEKDTSASQNKEVKIKQAKKRQKKASVKMDTTATTTIASEKEPDLVEILEIDSKNQDQPKTSPPPTPVVRRSKREAVTRQISKPTVAKALSEQIKTVACTEDDSALNQEELVYLSTPKKRRAKHGVFKAEMTCPPDEIESPIRIRFTRVNRSKEENPSSTPLVTKNSKESKKTKQAKKLLEKAKARKQTKTVSTVEKMLRRSSRTEASVKRSYCEDEDSIICVEEGFVITPQSVPEKSKAKTALRSLNDVLGKAAANKEAKSMPGSKVQEKFQDKAPRKPIPVSIFDDSSREGSENSQDDEQFKARRDFLKSGLPESFKKQMAKTAAAKEAYAISCASFHPVLHIFQMSNECPFWSLPWPKSTFLHPLKETWWQSLSLPSEINLPINWKTQPIHRTQIEMVSSWRPEIFSSAREALMKEISSCNPALPVQKFMNHFLKKQADLIHQCTASDTPSVSKGICPKVLAEATAGKRKRTEEEEEVVKVAKKQRNTQPAEGAPAKKQLRPRRGVKSVSEDQITAPVQSGDNTIVVLDDSPLAPKAAGPDVLTEDVLWTDKYQPQRSSEVIGNTSSVRQLYSWLKEWKLRADKEDKKKLKEQKQEDGSIDSDWECEEGDSQDAEDMLCNTMLITGPSGIGKTAAVYACAQELGFKIFEVNASSQRSGRLILSQLKEATQSHQVDTQGVNAHKPTYFNSYSASSGAVRPGSSPRKVGSPRRAVSSPRKLPQSPKTTKRGGLAPTALANFFKMSKPGNKEQPKDKEEQTAVSKKKSNEVDSKNTSLKSPPGVSSKDGNSEELSKKTATSLILFEEVDVIFEEDTGFLSAIKTFMMTTKRPVILTSSDPAFSATFDGNLEEIVFKPPSVLDVACYLQLLCLAENMRTDLKDISSLLSLNHGDIRRTLLQLQFWARSGGQRRTTPPSGQNDELQQKTEGAVTNMEDSDPLPVCETGCTESMLGLLNVAPQHNIWELLKRQEADFSNLVTMSRGQGLNLLYSNIETLLPLPTTTLTISKLQQPIPPPLDQTSVNAPNLTNSHHTLDSNKMKRISDDTSPVKVSSRMKKNRRRHCPAEQGALQSDSDSEDEFLSLKRQSATREKEAATSVPLKVRRKPLSREEQIKSVPVSQCLHSLAEFLDDMSFMDFMSTEDTNVKERCSTVVMKDGLTDEARIDSERWNLPMRDCALEIHAQVESLSFNKCSASVSSAWHKVQQLDGALREETADLLTLPIATHNESFTFIQNRFCHPQVVQQRREVMDELCLKGVFGYAVNRPAMAQDYLPALRTICRSEQLKEQGKIKRRFLHYLDSIHLGLQKSTLEHLAEDFP